MVSHTSNFKNYLSYTASVLTHRTMAINGTMNCPITRPVLFMCKMNGLTTLADVRRISLNFVKYTGSFSCHVECQMRSSIPTSCLQAKYGKTGVSAGWQTSGQQSQMSGINLLIWLCNKESVYCPINWTIHLTRRCTDLQKCVFTYESVPAGFQKLEHIFPAWDTHFLIRPPGWDSLRLS